MDSPLTLFGGSCFAPVQPHKPTRSQADLLRSLTLQPEDASIDIHEALLKKQAGILMQRHLRPFPERAALVAWLHAMGSHFNLNPVTTSTAVFFLDGATAKLEIPKKGLRLAALACLWIAAKWEEKELDIPTSKELLGQAPGVYTRAELIAMEMFILKAYNWNLTPLVAHSFLQLYTRVAITAEDTIGGLPAQGRITERELHSYAEYFIEVADKDSNFLRYPPSMVAASAVAAARACVSLAPAWPDSLHRLSRFALVDGQDCFREFCRVYDAAARAEGRAASPTIVADMARVMSPTPMSPSPLASKHLYQQQREHYHQGCESEPEPMCTEEDKVPTSTPAGALTAPVHVYAPPAIKSLPAAPSHSALSALALGAAHTVTSFLGSRFAGPKGLLRPRARLANVTNIPPSAASV